MRQSITTKYLGPTNASGSRIKATARKAGNGFPAQALTVPYTYEGTEREHCKAAQALAEKLGWSGVWVGGGNVDENGYVFVSLGLLQVPGVAQFGRALGQEGTDWFFVTPKEA
jgi:hypothetical protein